MVAVGGSWNAMPRALKIGSTESRVYKEAAAEILRSKGIENPKVNLSQVIQVDMNGDGVEEVLVSATNYAKFGSGGGMSPDSRAGDYSLVFLRKVVQGKESRVSSRESITPRPKNSTLRVNTGSSGSSISTAMASWRSSFPDAIMKGTGSTPTGSKAPKSSSYSAWDVEPEATGGLMIRPLSRTRAAG